MKLFHQEKLKYPLFGILLLILFSACEEVVDDFISVDAPSIPVADAWITNQKGGSYVRLSLSDNFNNEGQLPTINNASITVSNLSTGRTIFFREHNSGFYLPSDSSFVGEPLQNYRITIRIGSDTWEATSQMPNAPIIKDLQIDNRLLEIDLEPKQYLEVLLQDDDRFKNYYLWRLKEDGTYSLSNEILLSNDQGLNGENIIYEFPEPIEADSLVEVTLFAITEKANQYYRGVKQLTTNNGLSRTVPENPPSNFSEGILGFFTVTSITESKLKIDNNE